MKNPSPRISSAIAQLGIALALMVAGSALGQAVSIDLTPVLRCAQPGFCFCVRPAFDPGIAERVKAFRGRLAEQRAAGKLTAYMSVPLSGGSGSDFEVNRLVAGFLSDQLMAEYGDKYFYVLNPGSKEADLPDLQGSRASQGEYMSLWAQMLFGEDGLGRDFDVVYFAGPRDFDAYFKSTNVAGTARLERLSNFFDKRYREEARFKDAVDKERMTRSSFLRYYGLRASTSFSRGAHDEWNIVTAINGKRSVLPTEFGVLGLLPVFYNGNAIEPGDFQSYTVVGNATNNCKP
jgi:hypothetical protein